MLRNEKEYREATYAGYDRFYRQSSILWKDTADLVDINYGHDAAGRRTFYEDVVADANTKDLDQYDTRNMFGELTVWKLGPLNGGKTEVPLASQVDAQGWALDQVGNWKTFISDNDGPANQTVEEYNYRSINKANEITAITPEAGYPNWADPAYDKAGNMSTMPQPADATEVYYATYDAWNRLVKLENDGNDAVGEYEYDGLGRRIVKHVYEPAGTFDYSDHFYYSGWQVIEVRRDTDSTKGGDPNGNPLEQIVYHPYYIDAPAVRYYDADLNGEQDIQYYCHDAQFNVVALLSSSGAVLERYRYTPYGEMTVMEADFDVIASTAYEQYIGFTGQRFDAESGLWHFKMRPYHAQLGVFICRDPKGYTDGMSTYAGYFAALDTVDPLGQSILLRKAVDKIAPNGLPPISMWVIDKGFTDLTVPGAGPVWTYRYSNDFGLNSFSWGGIHGYSRGPGNLTLWGAFDPGNHANSVWVQRVVVNVNGRDATNGPFIDPAIDFWEWFSLDPVHPHQADRGRTQYHINNLYVGEHANYGKDYHRYGKRVCAMNIDVDVTSYIGDVYSVNGLGSWGTLNNVVVRGKDSPSLNMPGGVNVGNPLDGTGTVYVDSPSIQWGYQINCNNGICQRNVDWGLSLSPPAKVQLLFDLSDNRPLQLQLP